MNISDQEYEKYKLDIRKPFQEKNPGLYKIIPGFIFSWIERITHLKEMNRIQRTGLNLTGLGFMSHGLKELGVNISVFGEENLPKEGRYVFVANHPLGGLDGMVFAKVIGKHFPKLKFIVNDVLLTIKPVHDIFHPVNKHGRQSVENVKAIDEIYASDAQVLTFPAGICSRKINGRIIDLPWTKSFLKKAKQHRRDIIPVYFEGKNSAFFYNLANFRKRLGIKANFEMFLLPDEMVKQRNKTVSVTIGKPIPLDSLDKSKNLQEQIFWIKEQVYLLGGIKDLSM